ncbi:MAG: T9SS type A sorting domain-containing protein [Bacteroidetes bacterium]|nr:T9SS type A sorting domain-containing protein [Bacteroidota bacterium]
MKKLLVLILILWSFSIKAQTNVYHSFPDSAVWRVDYHSFNPFSFGFNIKYYFHYYITGDTIINSSLHKKIFKSYTKVDVIAWNLPTNPPVSTEPAYAGALRDDSVANKTFFVFPNTTIDSLLFDYNLVMGDTLKGIHSFYNLVISSVDSVLINGQYRTRWNFDTITELGISYYPFIIEGIGSSAGIMEPLYYYPIDFTRRYLVCIKDNNATLFTSDYNSSYGCNLIYEGINEINSFSKPKIYPNPFTESTTIEFEYQNSENYSLEIFNNLGQKVRRIENIRTNKIKIERGNFSSGIYFFQLKNDCGNWQTGKLVVE